MDTGRPDYIKHSVCIECTNAAVGLSIDHYGVTWCQNGHVIVFDKNGSNYKVVHNWGENV